MHIKAIILIILFCITTTLHAQITNDLLLSGAPDILKSDNTGIFEKAQLGLEAIFFVKRNFTVSAGIDMWTERDDSFIFGSRWYFYKNFCSRFRALIGENDFSIGLGGAIPINANWRFEIMGDYYFEREVALRAGVAYLIRL
jgi:hypothetical protein